MWAPAGADDSPGATLNLVLTVGSDETERNLAWYTDTTVTEQQARFAPSVDLVEGALPPNATVVDATRGTGAETTSGEYNWFASFEDLAADTQYAYQVGSETTGWSEVIPFTTHAADGQFDFLFFGDPQIGSSGDPVSDTAGWQSTLDLAQATYPNAELLFSAGDQVEKASDEDQYDLFLTPPQLQQIPLVPTIGNHDVGSLAYQEHYNIPHVDAGSGAAMTGSSSGGDYWFIYNGVLFIDINSNSLDDDSHIRFLRNTVADHVAGTRWQVLAFHHSIYSTARHSEDTDVQQRRADLPQTISELGIDLVLQGHDHSYARSYLLHNGEKANAAEQAGTDILTPGPGGVLYLTANSASGSKYYDQIDPSDANDQKSYLSVGNQEHVPNYTAVEVAANALTIKTFRSTAFEDHAANTVVDQMTLYPQNGIAPEIVAPSSTTLAQGADFDPLAGVTATDDVDGDVTGSVVVDSTVDTATLGTTTLTYSVPDSAGNIGTFERTILVVAASAGTVTMTGDVVPGGAVTISAEGLAPGSSYAVTLDGLQIGSVIMDEDGTATWATSLPSDLAAGTHTLGLRTSDGTQVTSMTFTMEVTPVGDGDTPPPAPASEQPTPVSAAETPTGLANTGASNLVGMLAGGVLLVAAGAGSALARYSRSLR